MLITKLIYIFADPFARGDSGVSSYINYARFQLSENKIKSYVITKNEKESISDFQQRLLVDLTTIKERHSENLIFEAPESYAVSKLIPDDLVSIHIRLHGSHLLGKMILGNKLKLKLIEDEQREISRAKYLSAPSESAVVASSSLFKIPKRISCYPNPAPTSKHIKTKDCFQKISNDKDVLYVGRIHDLKGAAWLPEIAKALPHISFKVVCPRDQRSFRNIPNLTFLSSKIPKSELFLQANLVIVPSLYETASMVGIEALSAGVRVLTWEHLGLNEYANENMIKQVSPFEIKKFIKVIEKEVSSVNTETNPTNNSSEINKLFIKGLFMTLSGYCDNFMLFKLTQERKKIILATINSLSEGVIMNKTTLPVWRRKLRKLKRSPIGWVKDSFFMKILFKQ